MPHYFTAGADALIRLDVGTGGNFLQVYRDGFRAFLAFERQCAGWFVAHVFFPQCGNAAEKRPQNVALSAADRGISSAVLSYF
jgi:hypothetical protein